MSVMSVITVILVIALVVIVPETVHWCNAIVSEMIVHIILFVVDHTLSQHLSQLTLSDPEHIS